MMALRCSYVNPDTNERCKSPFVLKETGMCRVHSVSREEWKASSARGGRRERATKLEENRRALEQRKPQMSEAGKLRVTDTIRELLRAITFDADTTHAVPDEERRALGAYLASQFYAQLGTVPRGNRTFTAKPPSLRLPASSVPP
jgi:hypothetical protein